MAKRKTNEPPRLSISDLYLMRNWTIYLYDHIQETDLPREVETQVSNTIEKLELLIRNGQEITYEELTYTRKREEIRMYDERNIIIYAMVFYRNRKQVWDDPLLSFVMRDIEERIGNPYYYRDSRKMAPLWFSEMEIRRGTELLDY